MYTVSFYMCIITVYTFYSSFCVQSATSVAPEATLSHPIKETTQNSNTGGSSCPLLVCLMVV